MCFDSPPRTGATRTTRRSKMLPARIGALAGSDAAEKSRRDAGGLVASRGAIYCAPTGKDRRDPNSVAVGMKFVELSAGGEIKSGICGLWELPTT